MAFMPPKRPSLLIIYSGPSTTPETFVAQSGSITIGRRSAGQHPDLDLSHDPSTSRPHARIQYEHDGYWLEDVGSQHGTWLNGMRITAKTQVRSGDKVQVGQTMLEVQIPIEEESPTNGTFGVAVSATTPSSTLLRTREGADGATIPVIRRHLEALYELADALGTLETLDPLITNAIECLFRAIPAAKRGGLLLQEGNELRRKAHLPRGRPSVSLSLSRRAIERREAFIWRVDASADAGTNTSTLQVNDTKCAMYAPLIWRDEAMGVVHLDNSQSSRAFDEDDLRLLMAMARQVAIFVKNHELQQEARREEVIRSNLQSQFSPKVAERLLQQRKRQQLGGERIEPVTVLVSDVRGFTAASAMMEPDKVIQILNEMFSAFIPILFKYDGTVDKFAGDSVLAVFGSPDPDGQQWEKAVRAAVEMQQAIQQLGMSASTARIPEWRVGIGIHTGAVVHGFVGSLERMDYTVIGDTVNRASRYCDGAGKGEVLISKEVYEHVFRSVEVVPKTISTKHPEVEADMEGYVVTALRPL
ncbi:MAG: adenylate/guanylate cyclase domain-containing protein [Dehalococcoidia bacterium]